MRAYGATKRLVSGALDVRVPRRCVVVGLLMMKCTVARGFLGRLAQVGVRMGLGSVRIG